MEADKSDSCWQSLTVDKGQGYYGMIFKDPYDFGHMLKYTAKGHFDFMQFEPSVSSLITT